MSPALIKVIEEQLYKVGEYGHLLIRVKHGRPAEFEATSSVRFEAGEAA